MQLKKSGCLCFQVTFFESSRQTAGVELGQPGGSHPQPNLGENSKGGNCFPSGSSCRLHLKAGVCETTHVPPTWGLQACHRGCCCTLDNLVGGPGSGLHGLPSIAVALPHVRPGLAAYLGLCLRQLSNSRTCTCLTIRWLAVDTVCPPLCVQHFLGGRGHHFLRDTGRHWPDIQTVGSRPASESTLVSRAGCPHSPRRCSREFPRNFGIGPAVQQDCNARDCIIAAACKERAPALRTGDSGQYSSVSELRHWSGFAV